MKVKDTQTPMMKQYFAFKAKYPDTILLMRVGDFYETFGDDAVTTSKVLGIVLTARGGDGAGGKMPLAGIPHHALEAYLPKLVRAGYKVAVCDQVEDPKLAKGLVKREITELVTPGIVFNENILNAKENNFLACLDTQKNAKDEWGVAFLDVSTGEFYASQGSQDYVRSLLGVMKVSEVVVESSLKNSLSSLLPNIYISTVDEWAYSYESCLGRLKKQFGVTSLKGYGIGSQQMAICAAGALLQYLESTQSKPLGHIRSISRLDRDTALWIDNFTFRNLEVFASLGYGRDSSLVGAMDTCSTPLGSRLLRSWLLRPSIDIDEISRRHSIVAAFVDLQHNLLPQIRRCLAEIGDMERMTSRLAAGKITPRELLALKRSLGQIEPLKTLVEGIVDGFVDISQPLAVVSKNIHPDSAAAIGKGPVIASGVDEELDSLRELVTNAKGVLDSILQREIERTGINSLKIGFNNVFGYFLEVRNTFRDNVPEEWIRKQTLVSSERYITPELKIYEERIMGAEEKILAIEARIYAETVAALQQHIEAIQTNCRVVAKTDVLAAFAQNAIDWNYCRPVVDSGLTLDIKAGRHAVIEQNMPIGDQYVPNDVFLDNSEQQIIILTGPNMAGKSALLRQTALIVLMAQVGSFVPAASAHVGIVDKLFTRVGASDNIAAGESTFMVEMLETATILNNLSQRSLILLDEIGRGTSTFDGMSIARSIVEYICRNRCYAKTLFATHYHELNDLEKTSDRIRNFHIAVKEQGHDVIFLRKLCPGGVAHSFGIHVARLAGMPSEVVSRAETILADLEKRSRQSAAASDEDGMSFSLFNLEDPLLEDLRDLLNGVDINAISPLQAFDLLRNFKERMGV